MRARHSPRRQTLPSETAPSRRHQPFVLLLALLIVLTTSRFHQHFSFLAVFRPALLIAVSAAAFAALNPRVLALHQALREWPMRVMVALGVMACLSALFGISQGRAGKFILEDYSKVLIAASLVAGAIRSAKDLRLLVWAYVVGSGILSFFALFVFKPETTSTGLVRLGGGYTYDANDIGCVLSVGVPLALFAFQTSSTRGKLVSAAVVIMGAMTVATSGSRGGFLGFTVLGVWLLVMLRDVHVFKRVAIVGVAALALTIKAPEGYWEQMQTMLSPKQDYNWTSKDGRKQIAERGLGYALDYPVFGIGIANFPMAEGTISDKARTHVPGTGIKWSAPHNSHLEVFAELGFPGLILWTSLLVGSFVGLNRLRSRLPRAWKRGNLDQRTIYYATVFFPVALIGFIVTSTFVSFAYNDPIYLLSAYVVGVFVSMRAAVATAGPNRQAVPASRSRRGRGGAGYRLSARA